MFTVSDRILQRMFWLHSQHRGGNILVIFLADDFLISIDSGHCKALKPIYEQGDFCSIGLARDG